MCQVGSVIRNPEIAALVPTLLISIADPNEHTKTSLELLLQVWLRILKFLRYQMNYLLIKLGHLPIFREFETSEIAKLYFVLHYQ